MKYHIILLSVLVSFGSLPEVASAKGCLKGAAVGGVAGHVAGSHGVLGAAVGCAIGRHRANKKAKEQSAAPVNASGTSKQSALGKQETAGTRQ